MARSGPLLLASALALLAVRPPATLAGSKPSKPFLDVGAGARVGIGEPTHPAVAARVGLPLSPTTALSLRPMLVIGNSDARGKTNQRSELLLPLTLDLFTTSTVSAYLGPGLAINADSEGQTNASVNAGVDIRLNNRLRLSAGMTYVFQPGDSNQRDIEANTLLYVRL